MKNKENRMAWNTVHHGNEYGYDNCRFNVAKEQINLNPVQIEKIKEVINKSCNKKNGIEIACILKEDIKKEEIDDNGNLDFDYKKLKKDYDLKDERDIVWMKFTTTQHIGVVASSSDINFQIPCDEKDYDEVLENGKWKYNSSGIIIHKCELEWDKEKVLICPILEKPKDMTRHGVEKIIGNSLIDNNIPIIDFYSHRIGGK